jgi:beta-galactosidase
LIRGEITVSAENGELIGLGSACPYYEKSYKSNIADTYYGEALAVIKPEKTGKIVVKAHSGYGDAEVEVEVE